MSAEPTTAVVQRYLDALAGDQPAEPIVRALFDRSVRRLQLLCTNFLYRRYRRLTLPPVNLQPEEMLDAVVERLLKALRCVRPQTVRQFFALVNQHMRWELNDLARRLDEQPAALGLAHPTGGTARRDRHGGGAAAANACGPRAAARDTTRRPLPAWPASRGVRRAAAGRAGRRT